MRTFSTAATPRHDGALMASLKALGHQTLVFLDAMTSPGKIIREVEDMRALQVKANRMADRDPAGAAALRQKAARIGLR